MLKLAIVARPLYNFIGRKRKLNQLKDWGATEIEAFKVVKRFLWLLVTVKAALPNI